MVLLPTADPLDEPLHTTGIQSDAVVLLQSSTVVALTSPPGIGIQPGEATTGIQSAPVSHLPTLPSLPTVGPQGDPLLTTGIQSNAAASFPSSSAVAHSSSPEIGIQLRVVATGIQSTPPGFVTLKHKWGTFQAELVNDPTRRLLPPAAPLRPAVSPSDGTALAALAFLALSGVPPHASDARQAAVSSGLPFHVAKPITPSDLGLIVRGE